MKTLTITLFDLVGRIRQRHSHVRLAQMLLSITSPVLSNIIFSLIPWAPSWHIDEGWTALDSALAQLVTSHPELRVVFGFDVQLPPCPCDHENIALETTLRQNLPLFLAQHGIGEVAMLQPGVFDMHVHDGRVLRL